MAWEPKYAEGHNQRRRERYANDEAYRQEQKDRAAAARAENRDEDGRLLKELNGVKVPVYKMADIAEYCEVSITRVRSAFKRGRLPEHSFEGKQVCVTEAQLELIKESFTNSDVKDAVMRADLEERW